MKKLIFRGPVQTASGYGVHARMLLRELDKSGKFDITVMSVPWGATPLVYDDTPEMSRVIELASKFDPRTYSPDNFDVSVQVTIPNEFGRLARRNVGVTAGIESDKVSPVWHQKCNETVDFVVVPSLHSARSFTNAIYNDQSGGQLMLRRPLCVLPEWVDTSVFNTNKVDSDPRFQFPSKFNFVSVGLGLDKPDGEDRKNFTLLVRWFCEQFKNSRDIGLILKLSMVNNSPVDFKNVKNRISAIKASAGCGEFPRIHLIHGRLTDAEMASLYKADNVKAFVSLTHGEGYGLPMIEAAACGLPVIATNWSGHLDFLRIGDDKRFVPVQHELREVSPSAVWKDVIEQGTRWAYPLEHDAKMKMAKVALSYDKPKEWATELAAHIARAYTGAISGEFINDVERLADGLGPPTSKNYSTPLPPPGPYKKVPGTTLVIVSTNRPRGAKNAITKTLEQLEFEKVLLVTSNDRALPSDLPLGTKVVQVPPFSSVADHDEFVMKKLADHVETEHFLTIQWDGYVLDGRAWNDEFLKYDYVGAPWFWNGKVGNAGFCLWSKKLAKELQSDEYPLCHPMDVNICETYRAQLESKGIKFAPAALANKFSVENEPYSGQLGWHGVNPFYGKRVEG